MRLLHESHCQSQCRLELPITQTTNDQFLLKLLPHHRYAFLRMRCKGRWKYLRKGRRKEKQHLLIAHDHGALCPHSHQGCHLNWNGQLLNLLSTCSILLLNPYQLHYYRMSHEIQGPLQLLLSMRLSNLHGNLQQGHGLQCSQCIYFVSSYQLPRNCNLLLSPKGTI